MNLYQQIADQLLRDIKNQKYPVGSRLPSERELAQQFSTSRPTVRKAIQYLESLGSIETRLGSGSYVKAGDMRQAAAIFSNFLADGTAMNCDVIEVRTLLDEELAAIAAVRRTDAQLQALKENITLMRARIAAGESWAETDEAFHYLVAAAANNPILYSILEICRGIYSYTIQLSMAITQVPEYSVQGHEEVYAAIRDQDPERARMVARQHMARTLYQYVYGR